MSELAIDKLTLANGGKLLVSDLTLNFKPGECWAVLGPNGSGKTTLLHALAGMRDTQGSVTLDGKAINREPRRHLAQKIGLLLQEEDAGFQGTVAQYVELGLFARGTWLQANTGADLKARAAMSRMGIGSDAGRLWNQLSGGERQRARLAQLLAQSPEIYLLDEPLLHLDLRHQLSVLQCFQAIARDEGKTVIMVLHDSLWASRFCGHALMLYDGGVCRFGPALSLINKANLAHLYSCSMDSFEFSLPA
ncbi:MAG: ABC transporter ATP-binding protein [Pseudomonadota bacterium]|nr:ABC transporter ATP-binding protein [Pseudomonadota bacterium]